MLGSNMQLSDFCHSDIPEMQDFNNTIEELNRRIKRIEEIHCEKGGRSLKLEELLTKYNKTEEDIDFEIADLSDEELEKVFAEHFEENSDNTDTSTGEVTEPDTGKEGTDNGEDKGEDEPESGDGENGEGSDTDDETDEPKKSETNDEEPKKKTYSVSLGDKSYTFESSLDEVIYALETLVNNTYSESDNTYYGVKVYDKYIVMVDFWTGKAYKQNYKVRSDVYSLTGDRVEVFSRYLTREEENTLDEMRSKFSEMETKLNQYQVKEEALLKDSLIKSEDYNLIKDSEEFKEISKNIEDYSLDELTKKCDELLLEYAKSNTSLNFSQVEKPKSKIRTGAKKEETYSPYGTLFQNYK